MTEKEEISFSMSTFQKSLIALVVTIVGGCIMGLGGFYVSANTRLSTLEIRVQAIEKQQQDVQEIHRKIAKIDSDVSHIKETLDDLKRSRK